MREAAITAVFKSDIQEVWSVITNNADYAWRSDLVRIDTSDDGKSFSEFTKEGYRSDFVITAKDNCRLYEFDMKNNNFIGHWKGVFSKIDDNGTQLICSEELYIKSPLMEILSRLFMNLKKIQATYIADVRAKLGE